MYCVCNRDIHKPFKIKERKRKSKEHIKKREKVGNKREGRKIKERKSKIQRWKKELFQNPNQTLKNFCKIYSMYKNL